LAGVAWPDRDIRISTSFNANPTILSSNGNIFRISLSFLKTDLALLAPFSNQTHTHPFQVYLVPKIFIL
jgi:hypothetical protein